MSTITTTNQITGAFDDDDKLTAKLIITRENARRTAHNATLPPPVPLLPMLLNTSAAERKTSCEAILNAGEAQQWLSLTQQAVAEYEATSNEIKRVRDGYRNAIPSVQDQVKTLLGITP